MTTASLHQTQPGASVLAGAGLADVGPELPLEVIAVDSITSRLVETGDGMADLLAHVPAAEAYALHDRLVRMGRVVAGGEAEPRPLRSR